MTHPPEWHAHHTVTEPGIYDMPPDAYHADPCPAPSLSSGIGRLMMRSPLHAWTAHPRLNPNYEPRVQTPVMVNGTVLHRMLLGKGDDYVSVDADDWRTKAAKERRGEITATGKTAVLAPTLELLKAGAERMAEAILDHPACADFFAPGRSEVVLAWKEGDVWLRAMLDRLPDDPEAPIYDLKTTGGSADPEEWQRQLIKSYAFQEAHYQLGCQRLGLTRRRSRPREFLFIVCETDAPHAVSVQTAAPSLLGLAEQQVDRAIAAWRSAIMTGHWPGYPKHIAYVEAPTWMLAKAEDQAAREQFMEQVA